MPSLINELALTQIKEQLGEVTALMLIDPSGLKAEESLALRRQLSDAGADMQQAKARILKKALPEDVGAYITNGGSLAVVSGEDIAAAAKVVNELVKEEKVELRAGLIEGKALDAAGAGRLADMPTKHEARAMVARALRAPVVKLGKVLKAPYRKLGRAVQAHKEKLED